MGDVGTCPHMPTSAGGVVAMLPSTPRTSQDEKLHDWVGDDYGPDAILHRVEPSPLLGGTYRTPRFGAVNKYLDSFSTFTNHNLPGREATITKNPSLAGRLVEGPARRGRKRGPGPTRQPGLTWAGLAGWGAKPSSNACL